MAEQKLPLWSRILNWAAPGTNKPAPATAIVRRPGIEPGPTGAKSVADQVEPNPESKSFGQLVEEMNTDYQIAFSNFVIAANVAAVQVSISVENGDGQKSDTLQQKLQKLWERTVPSMMPSVGFGRVAFEKGYQYDPAGPVTFVDKLEPMEYQDSKLKLTDEHKFDGFMVRVSDSPEKWLQVDAQNAWWLAINATAKNPHGISHYKGAVEKAWMTKTESMRNRGIYIRRYAIRGGVIRGPETVIDERTGQQVSAAEKALAAVENLYTGGTYYASNEPHHDARFADKGEYEWQFDEANVTALDPTPILNVIDKDDVAILRAFGIPEKTAIEGEAVGSFAMVSEQMMTLFALVDSFVGQWVESFQRYVVEQSREMNYGTGPGPKFTIHAVKLSNRPDSFVVQLVQTLAANPQFATVMMSGGIDLRDMLEKLGLPVTPELEQISQQVAARFLATQGAMAGAPPAGGAGTAGDPGTSPDAVPAEFANFSTLQLNRAFAATSKIQQAFIAGTDSETVARIKLKSIGWSQENIDKLIADASDGTIDTPIAMRNLIKGQRVAFQNFLTGLVKKKSLKP